MRQFQRDEVTFSSQTTNVFLFLLSAMGNQGVTTEEDGSTTFLLTFIITRPNCIPLS